MSRKNLESSGSSSYSSIESFSRGGHRTYSEFAMIGGLLNFTSAIAAYSWRTAATAAETVPCPASSITKKWRWSRAFTDLEMVSSNLSSEILNFWAGSHENPRP